MLADKRVELPFDERQADGILEELDLGVHPEPLLNQQGAHALHQRIAVAYLSQNPFRHVCVQTRQRGAPSIVSAQTRREITPGNGPALDVLATGGQSLRLEIPGSDANNTAHSIFRTDLAATLLEHVIGLRFGLLAVNRQNAPAQLERFAPVDSGHALVVERGDPLIRPTAAQVG